MKPYNLNIEFYINCVYAIWRNCTNSNICTRNCVRMLEQLGTNKLTRYFGIDKDLETKTKEDVYKVVYWQQQSLLKQKQVD